MKTNVYAMVTERIISQLDNGIIPWAKPWALTGGAWSRATGKHYSLLNQWLLPRGEYATFNQIKQAGGHVNKGEKGYQVFFFKPTVIEETTETGEKKKKTIPLFRYYTVFNVAEQTTGLDIKHNYEIGGFTNEPIEELERIKSDYLNREKVGFTTIEGDRAFYSPASDSVTIPTIEQFNAVEEYYSTMFHEFAHSTGHVSRLNRLTASAHFGNEEYSKEELVAEITAAAILNSTGIETSKTFKNSTAYIQNWRNAIANDNRLVVNASSKAQKAFEMIMNIKA